MIAALLCGGSFLYTTNLEAATTIKSPTNNGLVAWWTFDEATSTIAHDFSGNKNHGTLTNSPLWVTGKRGSALLFNGSNTYVTVPSISISSSITASAWVYSSSFNQNGFIVGKNPVNSQWELFLEGAVVRWRGGAAENTVFCNIPTNNQWHHIVGTQTGTTGTLYIDGVQCGTGTLTAIANGGGTIDIGRFSSSYYFTGRIDDVRLYSRALGADEILAMYRSGEVVRKNVSNTGLMGWWSFDEGTSTIAHDVSGNKKDGTLTNFASPPWVTGKYGKAITFDGVDDYVGVGNMGAFPTQGTISFWMNPAVVENYRNPFTTNLNGTNAGIRFEEYTTVAPYGGFNVVIGNDGGTYAGVTYLPSSVLIPNRWYHVILAWNTGTNTITGYLNGSLAFNTSHSLWPTTMPSVAIGNGFSAARYWQGKMDEVRIYNRTLSAQEAMTLYSQGALTIGHTQTDKITSGLIGMWSFNGSDMNWTGASSGTAYDRSGNNNHATFVNMNQKTSVVPGVSGQAVLFNGTSSYVEVQNSASLNPSNLTVSTWVKSNTATWNDFGFLVSKRDVFVMHPNQGATSVAFYIHNGAWQSASCTPTTAITKWNLYTMTWDGTTIRCYINGVAGGTAAPGGSINTADTGVLTIGRDDGIGRFLNGAIDETRMYNRALTPAEVKQLYLMGK